MKHISTETQRMLEALRRSVHNALERKKRLEQYAVTCDGKRPVVIDYSFSQAQGSRRQ